MYVFFILHTSNTHFLLRVYLHNAVLLEHMTIFGVNVDVGVELEVNVNFSPRVVSVSSFYAKIFGISFLDFEESTFAKPRLA